MFCRRSKTRPLDTRPRGSRPRMKKCLAIYFPPRRGAAIVALVQILERGHLEALFRERAFSCSAFMNFPRVAILSRRLSSCACASLLGLDVLDCCPGRGRVGSPGRSWTAMAGAKLFFGGQSRCLFLHCRRPHETTSSRWCQHRCRRLCAPDEASWHPVRSAVLLPVRCSAGECSNFETTYLNLRKTFDCRSQAAPRLAHHFRGASVRLGLSAAGGLWRGCRRRDWWTPVRAIVHLASHGEVGRADRLSGQKVPSWQLKDKATTRGKRS